jgi:hypothetical protein
MKTLKLIIALCFMLVCISAKASPPDTTGIIKMLDGKIIYLTCHQITIDDKGRYCFSDAGENVLKEKQEDIKYILFGEKILCGYGYKKHYEKKNYGLYEVLALNKKYVLLYNDIGNDGIFKIYDMESQEVETDGMIRCARWGMGHKKVNRKAMDALKEYFGDCKELMDKMQQNYDADTFLTESISGINCNGGSDIKDYIQNYKDYRTEK